jgi:hypothetical protein
MKKILFVYVVYSLFIFITCIPLYSQESGKDIAQLMWKELQAIKPTVAMPDKIVIESESFPADGDIADNNMVKYWEPISETCQNIFVVALMKAHKNNQIESFAKEYAKFFRSGDRISDMKWVLACPILTLPCDSFVRYFNIPESRQKICLKEEFKVFAVLFTKAIVENALDSKEYYQCIHHLSLWWGVNRSLQDISPDIEYYNKISHKKLTENDFEYWYAIRRLLSIAYLCNCEDILVKIKKNINNENILEAYMLVFQQVKLLGSWVTYDSNKLRYVVNDGIYLLPHLDIPHVPIYGASFSQKQNVNVIPRISRGLVSYFLEDIFMAKIKNVVVSN